MRFSVVAAALAGASTVYGHATFSAIYLNGVDQGLGIGKYIRGPPNNSPVKDVTSKDIICNVNNSPVPQTLEVSSGDQITMEWFHNSRDDDIIDKTHVGPVMVYIAPSSSNGEGPVWVKLFDQAFTDDWATNYLITAKGHVTITLPNLASGEYLLRSEIIALHEADTDFTINSARGAQFYMGCGQVKVVSSGSLTLPAGINFQTDYTHDGQGILFDVYSKPGSSYVSPGGEVSSIAVAGQLGIAPVPAAGSKPTTVAPSSVAPTSSAVSTSTQAVPTTAATPSTTVVPASAAQPTTTAEATSAPATTGTSRPPLNPSDKMVTVTIRPTSMAAAPTTSACPTTGTGSTASVKKYYQCGGIGYTGSTACEEGTTCKVQNPYYSQCL